MATPMTDAELDKALEEAMQVDEYTSGSTDDDDYVVLVLYSIRAQRHFRYVDSSGFNSRFNGASHIGEWLNADETKNWTDAS